MDRQNKPKLNRETHEESKLHLELEQRITVQIWIFGVFDRLLFQEKVT